MAAFGEMTIQAQSSARFLSVRPSVQAHLDYVLQLCSFRELAPLTRSRDRKDVALAAVASMELYIANRCARIV